MSTESDQARAARFTRRFVIAFAVVEALVIGWALLSGRLGRPVL